MTTPTIRFRRILSHRSKDPVVIATVDDAFVTWNQRKGWTCDCDVKDGMACDHVDAVHSLLDPDVTGPST